MIARRDLLRSAERWRVGRLFVRGRTKWAKIKSIKVSVEFYERQEPLAMGVWPLTSFVLPAKSLPFCSFLSPFPRIPFLSLSLSLSLLPPRFSFTIMISFSWPRHCGARSPSRLHFVIRLFPFAEDPVTSWRAWCMVVWARLDSA